MALSEAEQKLFNELEEGYPESWNFKEEGCDKIVGTVTAQRRAVFSDKVTQERKEQTIAVLQADSGEKRTIWMTSVLHSIFAREKVAIGDRVAIKYEGMETPESGGNPYHNFTVRVQKPEGATLDWSAAPRGGRRASDPPTDQFVPAGGGADFQGTDDDIPF